MYVRSIPFIERRMIEKPLTTNSLLEDKTSWPVDIEKVKMHSLPVIPLVDQFN
jgi:hypothetical protein